MAREIRIIMNLTVSKEFAVHGVLKDEEDKEVSVWIDPYGDAIQQPFELPPDGRTVYVDRGGNLTGSFEWKAPDGEERSFVEKFEIKDPPTCPRCHERVWQLADYICEECRHG